MKGIGVFVICLRKLSCFIGITWHHLKTRVFRYHPPPPETYDPLQYIRLWQCVKGSLSRESNSVSYPCALTWSIKWTVSPQTSMRKEWNYDRAKKQFVQLHNKIFTCLSDWRGSCSQPVRQWTMASSEELGVMEGGEKEKECGKRCD